MLKEKQKQKPRHFLEQDMKRKTWSRNNANVKSTTNILQNITTQSFVFNKFIL